MRVIFATKKTFRALYFCSLKTLIMIIEQIYTECLAKSAYYIENEDDLFRRMALFFLIRMSLYLMYFIRTRKSKSLS